VWAKTTVCGTIPDGIQPHRSIREAALYACVSTDDGRQTVENQVRQLRELARKFDIFREYTDEETGASANRASFLALLRDAKLRRFRILLIADTPETSASARDGIKVHGPLNGRYRSRHPGCGNFFSNRTCWSFPRRRSVLRGLCRGARVWAAASHPLFKPFRLRPRRPDRNSGPEGFSGDAVRQQGSGSSLKTGMTIAGRMRTRQENISRQRSAGKDMQRELPKRLKSISRSNDSSG
jgi:hypothetical protein